MQKDLQRFHNTTKESGQTLLEFQSKAISQDERITRFFIQRKGKEYSPSQVWNMLFNQSIPITSARRSITNLTKEGILKQTKRKVKGHYGRPEYCWKLA